MEGGKIFSFHGPREYDECQMIFFCWRGWRFWRRFVLPHLLAVRQRVSGTARLPDGACFLS